MVNVDTDNGAGPAGQRVFREAVNLWGTVDPWRDNAIAILAALGVDPDRWYDPVLPPGVDDPNSLTREVAMASINRYDTTIIGPHTPGRISKIELGHTILKVVLGGTEAHIGVQPLNHDDENALRARKLVMTALEQMRLLLPPELVRTADPATSVLEQQQLLNAWLHKVGDRILGSQRSGLEWVATMPPVIEAQPVGERRVFLSGTSVATSAAKEAFMGTAGKLGLPIVDSYTGAHFSEADMQAEYEALKASQISAVMITNDTETIAGTAEAPLRAALAALNLNRRKPDGAPQAQAFGLFIEELDTTKLSAPAIDMRQALLLHVSAIRRKFPGSIFVASSPEDLATWAWRNQTD